jgi:hypothetical protein
MVKERAEKVKTSTPAFPVPKQGRKKVARARDPAQKQKRKRSTTYKQARAYRRRIAKDMERRPEQLYGKTSAACAGRHICPRCMTLIDGEACQCGHRPPPKPGKLERTKGPVPVINLSLSNPADRCRAERVADALLGQSKAPRGLDRISERHRPARKLYL